MPNPKELPVGPLADKMESGPVPIGIVWRYPLTDGTEKSVDAFAGTDIPVRDDVRLPRDIPATH